MPRLDRRSFLAVSAASAAGLLLPRSSRAAETPGLDRYWHQWRGPLGTGEAPLAKPPVEWAEGRNVAWKAELPGAGKSTPVVWGDRLYVTAAAPIQKPLKPRAEPAPAGPNARPPMVPVESALEFLVLAVSRKDGKLLWRRSVREERPHEGTHRDGSYAAGSIITDGTRIHAFFGSRGLYALDMEGKVLWEKDLGLMQTRLEFGEGASPALFGDTLVVNWDHEGSDFIAAFDAATGRERWRKDRDEPTSWATPLVVVQQGTPQVVVGGTNRLLSYDLGTGATVWEAPGLTPNVIPSPVAADGMVYAMSGFRGNALKAVRLADAKGAIAGAPAIAWTYDRDTPYVPSPLLYRGLLYFLKSNNGVLTCLDAKTGELRYTERLEAVPNVYASIVGADGKVFVTGREGATVVLEAGPKLKILATNKLDDGFDASPALADGELYLRGAKSLYRLSASTL
jgi:outer membrane protein assembly factor BamB